MDEIRTLLLRALHPLISFDRLPRRYLLGDWLGRCLAPPRGRLVIGRVGPYTAEFDLRVGIHREMAFGLYDQRLRRRIRDLLYEGAVYYDIGANVGYFALLASELVG